MNLQKLPDSAKAQVARALEPMPSLGFGAVVGLEQMRLADNWIFSRLQAVAKEMNATLASYRYHEAAYTIYHFFWHEFCDWYLEWVKPEITKPFEGDHISPVWINLARVFEATIHLLHPFTPFITEELWHQLPRVGSAASISVTPFELVTERAADPISERQFETIKELIVAARNAKAEMGLQIEKPSLQVAGEDLQLLELFRTHQESIARLAALKAVTFTRGRLGAGLTCVRVTPAFDFRILHEQRVDHEGERSRLQKEREKIEKQLAQGKAQLENREFVARAPQNVVQGVERRLVELSEHHRKVLESLERLG